MTARMVMAYVAIAALALITSGVRAAYALSFCDIYPNRCQYTPSGKGYYYPQGYRLPSEMPGLPAGHSIPSRAGWGWLSAASRIALISPATDSPLPISR